MALADFLGQFLGNFTKGVGNQFNEISQLATGGPQGYAQQQENERQKASLAQQLNLHNTMTPYEQASLAHQAQRDTIGDQQKQFSDLLQVNQGVAQGLFQPASKGDTGAFQVPGGGLFSAIPAAKMYTIEKDSEAGKDLQLSDDLQVSADKYLDVAGKMQVKRSAAAQKAATAEALETQGEALRKSAADRFSPQYYESIYGKGNIDPQMLQHLTAFNNRINDALTIDKSRGNTEAIQGVGKDLDGAWQSPWEKGFQKLQDKQHELSMARISSQMALDAKYPEPSKEEITGGLAAYKMNGVKTLTALHQINPRLAIAVEQEGARQGLSPISLSVEEGNNSQKSQIALNRLNEAENLLRQPGVDATIGPVLSRYKAFMAGDIGSSKDLRVKSIQDKLSLARQVLGNIHYSARGSANQNVQTALKTLFDGDKMDLPTLLNGIGNVKDILEDYAHEGQPNFGRPQNPLDAIQGGVGDLNFKGPKR